MRTCMRFGPRPQSHIRMGLPLNHLNSCRPLNLPDCTVNSTVKLSYTRNRSGSTSDQSNLDAVKKSINFLGSFPEHTLNRGRQSEGT